MEPYTTVEYWNQRYAINQETTEWYSDWATIKEHLPFRLDSRSRVLHIGCGTSRLGQDLYEEGIRNVKNIDISPVCVAAMRQMFPHLDYEVMDVCRLYSYFSAQSFDVAIDKGCLDTLFCTGSYQRTVPAMLASVYSVLRPYGYLVIVSVGHPGNRATYLEPSDMWSVTVEAIPKNQNTYIDAPQLTLADPPSDNEQYTEVDSECSTESSTVCDSDEERPHNVLYICRKRH